jgi:hypothetical protein
LTYDLYNETGPDLRSIVASSKVRCGPIGLWEKFDTHVRIIQDQKDWECQEGRKAWGRYVEHWNDWPDEKNAEEVEAIDWGQYDIVISVDIAVPTRIVKKYTQVLWCYYWIEGGPRAIDTIHRGSPFYGYNVFLNHRPAKVKIGTGAPEVISMQYQRRTVLDFPYFILSSKSVQNLYPEITPEQRRGVMLNEHSYKVLTDSRDAALSKFGQVRREYQDLAQLQKFLVLSKYYVMLPDSKNVVGLGAAEAISAGCLALAPHQVLRGFGDLLEEELKFSTFDELIFVLGRVEQDRDLYQQALQSQQMKVDEWFFNNPITNLITIYDQFKKSACSAATQYHYERLAIEARSKGC